MAAKQATEVDPASVADNPESNKHRAELINILTEDPRAVGSVVHQASIVVDALVTSKQERLHADGVPARILILRVLSKYSGCGNCVPLFHARMDSPSSRPGSSIAISSIDAPRSGYLSM